MSTEFVMDLYMWIFMCGSCTFQQIASNFEHIHHITTNVLCGGNKTRNRIKFMV